MYCRTTKQLKDVWGASQVTSLLRDVEEVSELQRLADESTLRYLEGGSYITKHIKMTYGKTASQVQLEELEDKQGNFILNEISRKHKEFQRKCYTSPNVILLGTITYSALLRWSRGTSYGVQSPYWSPTAQDGVMRFMGIPIREAFGNPDEISVGYLI
jgi:hypothetical protein